jgi:hypothetical protein
MEMQQEDRQKVMKSYIQFQGLRYLSKELKKLLFLAIKKKWMKWVKYSEYEKIKNRNVLEEKAVISIQRIGRGLLARLKIQYMKYSTLYDSTICLQALFRGKLTLWKYQIGQKVRIANKSAILIQTLFRRIKAKKRVRLLKMSKNKKYASIKINSIIRMYQTRKRVKNMRIAILQLNASVIIQSLVRGFLGRCLVFHLIKDLQKFYAAKLIQKIMRGKISRMHLSTKRRETEAYWRLRRLSAVLIQKTYRGFRGKIKTHKHLVAFMTKRKLQHESSTKICNFGRCHLARILVKKLKKSQMIGWIESARKWQEMWSEETNDW